MSITTQECDNVPNNEQYDEALIQLIYSAIKEALPKLEICECADAPVFICYKDVFQRHMKEVRQYCRETWNITDVDVQDTFVIVKK